MSAPYWNSQFANNSGQIKVYLGDTAGPSTTEDWKFEGSQASSFHGLSLTIDDFNGDGVDDLVFGANLFDSPTQNDVGRVYVFYGDAAGFPGDSAIINGFTANERFGSFVSSAGDLNADGYADLLVGAFKHTDNLNEQGAAYLFPGTAAGLLQTPSWTGKGTQAGSGFGRSVSGAGDVNGDGYDDFLVGAYLADVDDGSGGTLTDAGQVFFYLGGPTCFADGEFHQDGDVNPNNSCQVCDTSGGSIDGWMNVDDALAKSCDDGNLCTENDVCVAGACVGTVKDCALDPAQACTIGVCDPTDGVCKTEGLPTTTQCEPAACVSETEAVAAGFCDGDPSNDGSGVCLVPTTVDCAPFKCDAGTCRTSCTRDNQCAAGAWCDSDTNLCSTANRAPTADAGADQIATMGSTVTLDGTASSDPDGDTLTYAWTQTSGEPVTFVDATSATPEFDVPNSANDQDVLEFQLVVNDGTVDSAPSDTSVLVTARPNTKPSAVITGPTTAEAGEMITLSAADSSDPEGDNLLYTWSLVSGEPAPDLGDASAQDYELTFPTDVTSPTTYTFLLVVNDGRVNSNPATHNVRVTPAEVSEDVGPETDAGPDAGPDAESDAGVDAGDDAGVDAGDVNELGGDLAGSGCSCSSGAEGQPLTPGMLFGAMALGGLALARRRRWMN
ncbi:PKD domain-containing protein [Bradymonas sediminis]|uniref:PKD domain-containing protein n=1 Tax=Bradymonas sediminis TaxID=1548548 RepID=UPI001EF91FB2|nr:PKD domain-containing protein [Bradymonas sediminis]